MSERWPEPGEPGPRYAATVSPGAVNLTPSLFSNSNTFYTATVALGAADLQPGLLTNSSAFYAATVSPGAVGLTPGLFTSTTTFYGSTVAASYALTPSLFSSAGAFYGPTVNATYGLTPSLYSNSQTFYAPVVAGDGSGLAPSLVTNAQTFYAATVTPGAVTIAPALFVNAGSFPAANVYNISALTLQQATYLYQLLLLHGLETGTPLTVSQIARVSGTLSQAIAEGGGSVTVTTTAAPALPLGDVGLMVDDLARVFGLIDPLVVTSAGRTAGALTQTISNVSGTTTVTRV